MIKEVKLFNRKEDAKELLHNFENGELFMLRYKEPGIEEDSTLVADDNDLKLLLYLYHCDKECLNKPANKDKPFTLELWWSHKYQLEEAIDLFRKKDAYGAYVVKTEAEALLNSNVFLLLTDKRE